MTYKKMLEHIKKPVTERNLFELGQWLGNEGARAKQNPDSEPEKKVKDNWASEIASAGIMWEEDKK